MCLKQCVKLTATMLHRQNLESFSLYEWCYAYLMWGTNLKRLTALLALLPSSLPSFLFSSSRMMLLKVWKKKQTRNFRNHHIFLTFQHYYIFDRTALFSSWNIPWNFPPLQSIMNVTRKKSNQVFLQWFTFEILLLLPLQVYLKITQWSKKKAARLLNGVHGHPVQWLVAKEFQWGPEVFFKRKRPKCWDVTGKWCRRKCVQHLFFFAKVILN